jgi:ABC-type multidrug transport system fused ATPase/permease subunit
LLRTNQEESSKQSEDDDDENDVKDITEDNTAKTTPSAKALMAKEEIFKDRLSWDTVKTYFKSLGGWRFVLSLGSTLFVERCFYVGTDVWLAAWTSASNGTTPQISDQLPVVNDRDDTRFYLAIYVGFAVVSAILAFSRVHIFAHGCVLAAKSLFKQLISNLMFAPMSFFETTPLGRVTNRLSYDTEVIDSLLLQRVNGVIASTAWLLGGVVVMIATIPFLALIVLPVLVMYVVVSLFLSLCFYNVQPNRHNAKHNTHTHTQIRTAIQILQKELCRSTASRQRHEKSDTDSSD